MVKDGTPQPEIMKTFGYKTSLQVKNAYYRALTEAGEVPGIVGNRRGGRKIQKVKTVGVGKHGSVVISKDLVGKLGVAPWEKFKLRKTKAGLDLKKVSE
jgi:hypothetical protein